MIADAHNHVSSRSALGATQTPEELLRKMDAAGVDHCTVFGWAQRPENDFIVETVAAHRDRFSGLACINPWWPDVAEMVRSYSERGLSGVKLHPLFHGYYLDDLQLLSPILEVCAELGLPVLIHSGDMPFCLPYQFEDVAQAFPDVPLIMAHSGFLWMISQAVRTAERNPSVYLETSLVDSTDVEDFVAAIGAERVIMGADTPWARFEMEIKKIELALPDNEARELVLGGNLMRLLQLYALQ